MSAVTVINLFLVPCLITILIFGALLNYFYLERNVYQKYLVATLSFWALVMMAMYVKFFVNAGATISFTKDICSVQVMLLGVVCFFSLISYPVTILNARFLTLKRWLGAVATPAICVAVYFAYHLIAGVDPFVRYSSMEELMQNVTQVSVILRLSMVVVFAYCIFRGLVRIWRVVPLYNQYVQDNIADSDCNVLWIRRFVKYVWVVTFFYFAMLFAGSPYVNCIYLLSLVPLFCYICRVSLIYRTSEHIERLEIRVTSNNRWEYALVENGAADTNDAKGVESAVITIREIDKWMVEQTPYACVNFTTDDIIEAFPTLTHPDLVIIFRTHGETFQAYVRRFRILRACEIIENRGVQSYPKQTFAMVGFSHHSSFSRSFVALAGISPSDYLKLDEEARSAVKEQIANR